MRPLLRDPDQAADTVVWLVSAPSPPSDRGCSGTTASHRRPPRPVDRSRAAERARLWDECARLCDWHGDQEPAAPATTRSTPSFRHLESLEERPRSSDQRAHRARARNAELDRQRLARSGSGGRVLLRPVRLANQGRRCLRPGRRVPHGDPTRKSVAALASQPIEGVPRSGTPTSPLPAPTTRPAVRGRREGVIERSTSSRRDGWRSARIPRARSSRSGSRRTRRRRARQRARSDGLERAITGDVELEAVLCRGSVEDH